MSDIINKRSKALSFLLSVITPGLGHLYNGKLIWAIVIPSTIIIFSEIIYYYSLIKSFSVLLVFILFAAIVYIFSIVHSIILAKRNSDYRIRSYNRVYIYFIWPILFFGIGGLLPENYSIQPFRIPTKGMEKTLKIGDMILVDMDYYKNADVRRNDIVVFSLPEYPQRQIIKRVIAVEGEKISIVNGKVFINDAELIEDNPNIVHGIDNYPDLVETIIPHDYVFLIGDNRPNSLDSRIFGPIHESNVFGKPLYIYFSNSLNRIGLTL